ncbi:hypothetical protein GCK72_025826 [Caenorhabditis remanei]|uniref:CUB domain-containing protein n=1 Tax=Caenorhabditis remanei TaxID=31234 RepID=A0A6A5G4E4_CAERE|nr:hypothetical protein GCK72_025826 [Caenorhabditis remanei]KAF1749359.1 hypothetical protein GCK72_025826 [Caenorhabditis remanei]
MKYWLFYSLLLFLLGTHLVKSDDDDILEYKSDIGDCPCEVETYEADEDHGVIKSPNYPKFDGCDGRCIYVIRPHINKTVTIYTSQFEISQRASLIIYTLVEEKGQFIRIPHAKIKRPYSYYYNSGEETFPGFVSAKNAGYEIHFISHTTNYYTSFKMSFDRNYEYEDVCDYPIVDVGLEETVVQRKHQFRAASGCVYMLRANESNVDSDEDEIMINIEESDYNLVSVRSNDAYGKLKAGDLSSRARTILKSAYNIQILSHKSSRTDGNYKMTEITAKLIKKKCECGPLTYTIDIKNQSSVSLRSPGFPDLYCPNRDCKYTIKTVNYQYEQDKIGVLEVKIKSMVATRDSLVLRSEDKYYLESNKYKAVTDNIEEHFVIKQQQLFLDYSSYDEYDKRFFEVNVTQIMIDAECSCSFYKEKKIGTAVPAELDITFPAHCTFIYCNFDLKVGDSYRPERSAIEFQVIDAASRDLIVIKDKRHEEKYHGSMLQRKNRFEPIHDSSFTYYRENHASNFTTRLMFNYTVLSRWRTCNGGTEISNVDYDKPVIITNPGFPQGYDNDLLCKFLVNVPAGCRMALSIDEVSLENFHDHISIYEGNSTEGKLIQVYTAHISHQVLNVSTTTILIVFQTDQSTTDRGFHITATAQLLLDEPGEETNTRTYILIALVLVLIFIIVFVLFIYEKYYGSHRIERRNNTGTTGGGNTNGTTMDERDGGNGGNPPARETVFNFMN